MKYCLGTVQFGLEYGIQGNGKPNIDGVRDIIEYAFHKGIDMFDTAAAYGTAENVVGGILAENKNLSQIHIISKLSPTAFNGVEPQRWTDIAVSEAEESLIRLRTNKLYAYLFHNAFNIFNEAAVEALYAVYEKGIAERVGVSIYTPEEAMKALDYKQIRAVQIPYNVFDQRLDQTGFFKKAKERDVLIFARSSLLQGLLLMNPEHLPEKVQFAKKYLKRFLKICDSFSCDPLKAAVSFVGSNEDIDYVVFGTDTQKQLKEYLSVQDYIMPQEMMTAFQEAFECVEDRVVNPSLWDR